MIISSGLRTTSGLIHSGPTRLVAFKSLKGNTGAGTVILYDSSAGPSGAVLAKHRLQGANDRELDTYPTCLYATSGVWCEITGSQMEVIVYYNNQDTGI